MDVAPLHRHVKAGSLPLEALAKSSAVDEQDKVNELSRQFEAVMLRQILQDAQKTVIHSKYHQDNAVNGIYQDMIVNQLADGISRSGGLGLADSIEQQLGRQLLAKSPPPDDVNFKDGEEPYVSPK
jgi:Rod binding domain-containing protein